MENVGSFINGPNSHTKTQETIDKHQIIEFNRTTSYLNRRNKTVENRNALQPHKINLRQSDQNQTMLKKEQLIKHSLLTLARYQITPG